MSGEIISGNRERTTVAEVEGRRSLVKLQADGKEVRNVNVNVPMFKKAGHLCEIQGKWTPTADGYYFLNRFIGVNIAWPDTILSDTGQIVGNPYTVRDEYDNIKRVTVRRFGIGRNALGDWVVFSYQLTFDVQLYIAQDFFSEWRARSYAARENKPARTVPAKAWGQLLSPGEIQEHKSTRGKLIVRIPSGVALLVDLSNPDVQDLLADHIHRHKFAERLAQTMCDRNILRRFSNVGTLEKDGDIVKVTSWVQTHREMSELRKLAEAAKDGRPMVVDGKPVEYVQEAAVIDDPDEVNAASQELSEEAGAREAAPEPEKTEPKQEPKREPHARESGAAKKAAGGKTAIHRERIRELARQLNDAQAVDSCLFVAGVEGGMQDVAKIMDEGLLVACIKTLEDEILKRKQNEVNPPMPKSDARPIVEGKDGTTNAQ